MKKIYFPVTLFTMTLVIVLAACGSTTTGSSSSSSNVSQTLAGAAQLLVGTLKLEGTDNAVDAAQAASLLPLWQAYSELTNSDIAAQSEIDAVVAQILSTMTKDQLQAVTAMKLTSQDKTTVMGSLGLVSSDGTSIATSTPKASSSSGNIGGPGAPSGPGGSAGGDPGGGGPADVIGIQSGSSTTQVATLQTSQVSSGGILPALLNALIKILQKRAAE